ncbi:MocR-like pyridoxine biosynthesis transcription factor PdxR [Paenibacillus alginolyticus]|uniref:PLP-dependent aminotransferase family protein n=1 Tax=Paenibacillus alginolyticus TaxID=59839 RepID=A0ABT4GJX4_9BACL|nr:PLP-dependent aminotransferase family protein [Paenibacillus alginolyticus]MCY9696499.1 PLP-dependent aminotransferase family protein [Paenibacillus alginolyticus]MEC0141930.1 PLP-dependent aminotransferase family protein [Paenibacillus alginolyticus]
MFDILLTSDEQGPLYIQLYRQIRGLIQRGDIPNGMKLPSIRMLSQQIHFSKNTIETAYQMLIEEGYVMSKPRSGLYVVAPLLLPTITNHQAFDQSQNTNVKAPQSPDEAPIDFSLLEIDTDSFPLQAWKACLNESFSYNSGRIHQYGDNKGEYALRLQIAHYLKQSRGVSCSPEQIVVGTGMSNSLQLLSKLIGQSARVAFEKNAVAQVGDIFTQNGYTVVPFPLSENELNIDEIIPANIDAVYVTPSHRPSGNPLSYTIRQELIHWAYHNQRHIIEDDYDGEFRHAGKTIPSLQGLDQHGIVIYIGTFSKAFTPALRMNYMVLPHQLLPKLHTMERTLSSPSRMDQLAMALFMERGHWYRHIRRMRNTYRKKHERILHLIQTHLGSHVQIESGGAGLHIELTFNRTCSAEKLKDLALAKGVRVYSSQQAEQVPNNKKPKIYLGFGGITIKDMERGIPLLKEAWIR